MENNITDKEINESIPKLTESEMREANAIAEKYRTGQSDPNGISADSVMRFMETRIDTEKCRLINEKLKDRDAKRFLDEKPENGKCCESEKTDNGLLEEVNELKNAVKDLTAVLKEKLS